ncbi:MAG TPA: hypothetical protein EYN96_10440 [Candidatus Hydrogenedentes bacterium]|nr:hypothetical protein [Candidatus Hydrogenedentota bacterium]
MSTTVEHLTDLERALFYYTLPRVRTPFPTGVTVVYAVAMLLAAGTIVYGVSAGESEWLRAGVTGLIFGGMVGIGSFMLRDFMNQVRERTALASVKGMPDADSHFDDIPDPFGEHVLLRYPIRHTGKTLSLEDNKGETVYVADLGEGGSKLSVSNSAGEALFTATLDSGSHSFSFETGSPRQLTVEAGGEKVADVRRRSNFGPAKVDIESFGEGAAAYQYRAGGLFLGDALVGRIYEVRQHHYLDVESKHFCDGILSFFVTIG